MRKSIDGLAQMVEPVLGADAFGGPALTSIASPRHRRIYAA